MIEDNQLIAIIRLRGPSGMSYDNEYTLKLLNLKRANHATILNYSKNIAGMLRKVNGFITWGEIDEKTLLNLLSKKSNLNIEMIKKAGYNSIEELTHALYKGEINISKLKKIGFKPIFRLHPPSHGFKKSIKRKFKSNGEAGYRGKAINDLLNKMI